MINGIGLSNGGSLGIAAQTPTQRSEAAAKAKLPTAALEDSGQVSTTVSQISAMGAPVDSDRVASLRSMIRAGVYRPDPQAIAQKMIASDIGASL